MKRLITISFFILALLLSGCAQPAIKDINSAPEKFLGKKVVVSGKVFAPLDVGVISGFTLKDDGSSVMISSDTVPEAGEEVTVKGTVVRGLFSNNVFIYADSVR